MRLRRVALRNGLISARATKIDIVSRGYEPRVVLRLREACARVFHLVMGAATKTAKAKKFQGVSVRTDEGGLEERLDRIALELAKRAAGVPYKRAQVARHCLEKGVAFLEKELGIAHA